MSKKEEKIEEIPQILMIVISIRLGPLMYLKCWNEKIRISVMPFNILHNTFFGLFTTPLPFLLFLWYFINTVLTGVKGPIPLRGVRLYLNGPLERWTSYRVQGTSGTRSTLRKKILHIFPNFQNQQRENIVCLFFGPNSTLAYITICLLPERGVCF